MSFATGICMFVSQAANWPMSFIAPIFTMFILALPMPALKLAGGIKFALVFIVSIYAALLLLPMIVHYRVAGLLLVSLALFLSFYYTARGGSPVLGAFTSLGITLVTAVGSVSIDAVLSILGGLDIGIIVGILFVWVGHALVPDSLATPVAAPKPAAPPPATDPDNVQARRSAYRSLLIVMPILIWFLLSGSSASYVAVMIKVTSMGQQASLDKTREAAKSLLISTLLGGLAAIIGWPFKRVVRILNLREGQYYAIEFEGGPILYYWPAHMPFAFGPMLLSILILYHHHRSSCHHHHHQASLL